MTHIEQRKIIRELRDYEFRMTREDLEMFRMFRKRDADDEDLDMLSKKRLSELMEKYIVRKKATGNPLDALFQKKNDGM